jgi:glyoxylase-like metal-dependent hydrolase (beta-lactamase superfamily II)
MPVSHTDGDLVVWFKDANVLHTGDLFFADRFPFIDLNSGGSVSGYISNVKLLLSQIDEKTKLIPGHGDLMDKAGLERFLMMMQQTLAEVSALKAQGKTEDQIVAQGLSAQWKSWSWHFITEERWIRTLFKA